ncbi:MAG: M81 family metallopeptidase [Myxococcales bacterium]|nr:M81 family metallopeptidase [Myxococcales bacterium]
MTRIAVARFMQETNALTPVPTDLRDFEQSHYLVGAALAQAIEPGGHEVAGFFKKAELAGAVAAVRAAGATPVPILSAWASSGGKLTRACFDTLAERLADGLRAARPDGVVLALHGAMGVDGLRDPETELLRIARDAAGGVPLTCTHDLHANLTPRRCARCSGGWPGPNAPARSSAPRRSWSTRGTTTRRWAGRPWPTASRPRSSASSTSWPRCAGPGATSCRRPSAPRRPGWPRPGPRACAAGWAW